jgi:hypothetical protein
MLDSRTGVVVVAVVGLVAEGVDAEDPLEVPPPAQEEVNDSIFALVSGPTLPTGLMPCALWKAATAFSVTAPK